MAEAHPVGFRWVMKAKEQRRDDHSCRSTIFADERAGRHLGADPRRQLTSHFSADSSVT